MLTDAEKLKMIREMLSHPCSYGWSRQQMANAVERVILSGEPIRFDLSDEDAPIPYELAHDAVYEEVEDS